MTKVWQKPKLIILYRGRPEECVLLGCKTSPELSGGGPLNKNSTCYAGTRCNFLCNAIENS